jgi:ADP-heptose:LPS heptosyltransferase
MIWKMKFYDDVYLTGSYSRPYAEAMLAKASFARIHNATLYSNMHEHLKIKKVSNYFYGHSEERGRSFSLDVLNNFIRSGSLKIPDSELLTISLGSSDYKRLIDIEFINIVLTKAPSYDFQVAIICTLNEETNAYILRDKLHSIGYKDCIVHVAIPLQDVMHLISRSALFIGGDTGLSHFAVLSGIKSIIYAAGGHWGQFFPYPESFSNVLTIGSEDKSCFGCNHKCKFPRVKNKFPCMLGYNPAKVARLSVKFLTSKNT